MANSDKQLTLAERMAAIMADVRRVEKRGTNTHFRYDYVTAEDVKDTLRPLLAKYGVAIFPSIESIERAPAGKQELTRLKIVYTISGGGQEIKATWYGEALDNQDKGINKALTAATKYFLINTFLVSTGDEPDVDGEAPVPQTAPAPRPIPPHIAAFFEEAKRLTGLSEREIAAELRGWEPPVTEIPRDDAARAQLLSNLVDSLAVQA